MLNLLKHSSYVVVTLMVFATAGALRAAPLAVTASVMPQGANFLYGFVITNQSFTDPDAELVSVDLPSLPIGSVVGNATAPAGFGAVTDLDYILFSYDNGPSFPLNVATGGFQFLSTTKFSSIAFEASYLNAAESQVDVFSGAVSPQAVAAVPEPSGWLLLAPAVLFLGGRRKVRR